jgi:hypothetical protein
MSKSSAISHESDEALGAVDWEKMVSKPKEEAAEAVRAFLGAHEGIEERIFIARMRVLRVVEKLSLWELDIDPEIGEPFRSLDRWMKVLYPRQWGYCRDAMRTDAATPEIPMEDKAEMSVANLKVLADSGLSTGIRKRKDVIAAAKTKSKEALIEFLNEKYDQHIEPVTVMPRQDIAEFEQAIEMAMVLQGCKTRAEAIKEVAVSYIQDHAVEWEHADKAAG